MSLYRSQSDKILGGVCGGVAQRIGISSSIVRLVTLILFFVSGFFPVGLIYFVLMYALPKK
ncbi:PspC domain-containing protein [Marininema halotolerans]|uniref:Phage shock protein PspC (Stress-responsive transcriptional regulator) n=1 Tax=Marininema halotolerans TaxID=1155944 RepID=A0A1I6NY32_9BACL|nr:PspC domain-containing protein [Marininema halotolerans]SFS32892.1 Phage shock protein PspC (stress-responsive transcriptional regulator) [Marininema halotolerans]